mgnify:CR=1 FL=1
MKKCQTCRKTYTAKSRCEPCAAKRRGEGAVPYIQLKIEVMNKYGGCKCSCVGCVCTNLTQLTIDHIDGNGAQHRHENKTGGGHQFYLWLKRNNYPTGFRVLCDTCNFSRGHVGYCIHEAVNTLYGSE